MNQIKNDNCIISLNDQVVNFCKIWLAINFGLNCDFEINKESGEVKISKKNKESFNGILLINFKNELCFFNYETQRLSDITFISETHINEYKNIEFKSWQRNHQFSENKKPKT